MHNAENTKSKLVVRTLYPMHAFGNERDPKWDLIILPMCCYLTHPHPE